MKRFLPAFVVLLLLSTQALGQKFTQPQKNTFKAHIAANTNTTSATALDGSTLPTPFVINTQHTSGDAEKERAIADWYNRNVTGTENQAFTTPNELWVPDVGIQALNAAIDWGTPIPHGLGGSPTVTEINTARTVKWLAWQSLTWNSKIDLTDGQQRAGVFNTWGTSPNATTDAIAAIGTGRKTPRRMERLFAGNAVGQAGIGGQIGRVCPTSLYGQTVTQAEINDIVLNGQ